MTTEPSRAVFRHALKPRPRFDFRKLRPAWLRYGLALAVVVPIVLWAWASFRDDPIPESRFAPYVPFVGWFVVAVLVLAVGLRLYGAWRTRRRAADQS